MPSETTWTEAFSIFESEYASVYPRDPTGWYRVIGTHELFHETEYNAAWAEKVRDGGLSMEEFDIWFHRVYLVGRDDPFRIEDGFMEGMDE